MGSYPTCFLQPSRQRPTTAKVLTKEYCQSGSTSARAAECNDPALRPSGQLEKNSPCQSARPVKSSSRIEHHRYIRRRLVQRHQCDGLPRFRTRQMARATLPPAHSRIMAPPARRPRRLARRIPWHELFPPQNRQVDLQTQIHPRPPPLRRRNLALPPLALTPIFLRLQGLHLPLLRPCVKTGSPSPPSPPARARGLRFYPIFHFEFLTFN
jgi:hypothetical protein